MPASPHSSGLIMVCGSRRLPGGGVDLAGRVVRSVLRSGRGLVVGCAAGADAAALDAGVALDAGRVSVLAAFGPGGAGCAGPASAVAAVEAAAQTAARVAWWAGGDPAAPLRARLARRSLAAVELAAASGPGAGLVALVRSSPPRSWSGTGPWWSCGSGSWSSVAAAAALGLTPVVFVAGALDSGELPMLPSGPGRWVRAGTGLWSVAWRWLPAGDLF